MIPITLYFLTFESFFRIYQLVSKILFHPCSLVMKEYLFF